MNLAGVGPDSVTYVEAHGTGTVIGEILPQIYFQYHEHLLMRLRRIKDPDPDPENPSPSITRGSQNLESPMGIVQPQGSLDIAALFDN